MNSKTSLPNEQLDTCGCVLLKTAASNILPELERMCENFDEDAAGIRLFNQANLVQILSHSPAVSEFVRKHLGDLVQPVRATIFNKSSLRNWSLGWHQDRTISVRQKIEMEGYSNWNHKSGQIHVEPPFPLLERMLTLRIHIDDVDEENAPLIVSPGSHMLGKIPLNQYDAVVEKYGEFMCIAETGDVWVYRTPILHRSEPAKHPSRRRVLQVDFSADQLPENLEWTTIG